MCAQRTRMVLMPSECVSHDYQRIGDSRFLSTYRWISSFFFAPLSHHSSEYISATGLLWFLYIGEYPPPHSSFVLRLVFFSTRRIVIGLTHSTVLVTYSLHNFHSIRVSAEEFEIWNDVFRIRLRIGGDDKEWVVFFNSCFSRLRFSCFSSWENLYSSDEIWDQI